LADRRGAGSGPDLLALLPPGFVDHPLYNQALTHRSAVEESLESNERLEFLGDAVLELVVTDHLYERHPSAGEGRLTKLRAALVSRSALARRGLELGVDSLLIVGQADAMSANARSNAVEAIIGALYEAYGLDVAAGFVLALVEPMLIAHGADPILGDFKSRLHEILVQARLDQPTYEVSWTGPDHDRRFRVDLTLEGLGTFVGEGHSRKEAEQAACQLALDKLEVVQAAVDGPDSAGSGPRGSDA